MRKDRHYVFLDFLCKTKSKKVTLNSEAEEFIWIMPEKALSLDLDPSTKLIIEKFWKEMEY